MLLTVDSSLTSGGVDIEIDARPGTSLARVLAVAGVNAREAWCGGHLLQGEHPAGVEPLRHGARLSARSGEPTSPPRSRCLAVVAGPDAGAVVPLDTARVWGRSTPDGGGEADVLLADPALSRRHARIGSSADGAVVADLGSTNGTALAGQAPLLATLGRKTALVAGQAVRLGSSWVMLCEAPQRGGADGDALDADHRPGDGRAALGLDAYGDGEAGGARGVDAKVTGMLGGAASGIVLAAITGRWYLALISLVYPLVVLGPALLARLSPPPADLLAGLPLLGPWPGATPAWLDGPVAVTGASDLREAMARALILARRRRPPAHPHTLDEPWMRWLPPARSHDGAIVLTDAPPSWCETHLVAQPDRTVLLRHGTAPATLAPWRVTPARADAAARRIASTLAPQQLPREVRWADLTASSLTASSTASARPSGRRFTVPLGMQRDGDHQETWWLDLDADGPHLLVAGTTGAGKSAFLETLVLALAYEHGPESLEIALLDFKGGAGLASCLPLPHVVGTVTDLDGRQARRALAALEAALRERKQMLAAAGQPSFTAWEAVGDAPPRLLVVVDEFQEIGALHRDFMPGLNRLAAQGRSLGMHVVLATQRPSGAVTPEIRANTSTTIALRVASDAESRDLVGTGHAASLPLDVPGRAIVATATTRREVQLALPLATPSPDAVIVPRAGMGEIATAPSTRSLAAAAAERHRGAASRSALWHPPLPATVTLAGLESPPGHLALGLEDWPDLRERGSLTWDVAAGPLVVVAPPGPVRASALACATAGAPALGLVPVHLPSDPREAARTLHLASQREDIMLIVPDAPAALAALAQVDRGAGVESLLARAASGALVLAVNPSATHRIAHHAGLRLVAAGLGSQDEAQWTVPRDLAAVEGPFAVRAWSARGWREAVLAEATPPESTGTGQVRLVAPLPDARGVSAVLHRAAQASGGMIADESIVGVGGDDAAPITLRRGATVAIVGPPGAECDATVAALERAGACLGAVVEFPALLPPQARGGIIVAVEPHPRIAEELCRGHSAGLTEPSARPGRVLWVEAGRGRCVQLVSPPTTAATAHGMDGYASSSS